MSDAVATKKTPKKKSVKPAAPRQHPPYGVMIRKAIATLKDRKGSSRQALIKYIRANFKIGAKENAELYVRMALRAGAKSGKLVQTKGTGASGSFRLAEKKTGEKAEKKPKSKATKKRKSVSKKTAVAADGTATPAKPKKAKKKASPKKRPTPKKSPKVKAKRPAAKKAGGVKKAKSRAKK